MTKFLLTTVLSSLIILSTHSAEALFGKGQENPRQAIEQERGPHMFGEHHQMHENNSPEKMESFLNLSEEQKAKAKKIREESRKETEPLMQKMNAIRKRMDEIHKADMQKFEALLTPEQKAKLDEVKQKNGEMRGKRPEHNFPHRDFKNF